MSVNLEKIKNVSRSFRLAADRNLEERQFPDGKVQILTVPAVVCLAFSIEVGFKALLLESGRAVRGHDLSTLFSYLPPDLQDLMYAGVGRSHPEFDIALSRAARIFEEWRYIYELASPSVDLRFLTALADVVQREL